MTQHTAGSRTVYAELSSPTEMAADARVVASSSMRLQRAVAAVSGPAPSLRFEDFPHEQPKRGIRVSDAAARLANALHLHLD